MSAHEATLAFSYADQHRARLVTRSVRQEVGEIDDDRSSASVECSGATVEVTVRATDLVALRAAMNTWLGLVGVTEQAADAVERAASA